MVVSGNDPLESFLNSIQLAISPLESNFRKIAKNFEHSFNGVVKNGNVNWAQLNVKKSSRGVDINGDDQKKGEFPIKISMGMFAEKCGSKDKSNFSFRRDRDGKVNVNLSKKLLQERYGSDDGVNRNANHLPFEVALSFLINGIVQSFLSPFKAGKMGLQNISKDSSGFDDSQMRVEGEHKVVGGIKPKGLKVKEGKDLPFEYLMGLVFDQLSNFPKFDVVVQDHKDTDYEALAPSVNKFDHFKALKSFLDGKRAGVDGFFGNLKFARVGGVPWRLLGVHSIKDVGEECKSNNVDREESGGNSLEKMEYELLSFPLDQPQGDPRSVGCGGATVIVPPPAEIPTDSVLKSALAGRISCSFSTFLMHPIDTVKTQVQASSTLSFTEILSKLPELGVRGLYMGIIPAIVGQFSSHGLRTGICEVSKIVLINVAPSLPEIQVQSIGSFLGTFLGTTMRIPCEVLKQRLQAGQFNHVGEALIGTWQQDGLKGFFRGTGMTLCRELPFYVAGSGLYTESKKAVQKFLGRELEPWETIVVGAISGGLTAVSTTPFDVIKTRMMTALQGQPTTMSVVALSILRHEGPLGLFRGAVPRFFWVAPLGAINFAGYELIRKAMD